MPGLKSKSYGTGSYAWLLNTHSLRDAATGTLDVSSFTAGTHYPNGFFPNGLIVNVADLKQVKVWTGAEGEKFAVLSGDVPVNGTEDVTGAFLLGQGAAIKTSKLPITTNLPTAAPNGFVFVSGA